jgi:hypothetical protein
MKNEFFTDNDGVGVAAVSGVATAIPVIVGLCVSLEAILFEPLFTIFAHLA